MSNASSSSKPGSGTMLPSGRKPVDPRSEAGYLAQQAADAKAAFTVMAREMGTGLEQVANAHPLVALGLAVVSGALVARMVAPHPHHGHNGDSAPASPPPKPSFIDNLLADTIQPVLRDLAVSVLGVITSPKTPDQTADGR